MINNSILFDKEIPDRVKCLIRQIKSCPDFGYDDLEVELDEELKKKGLDWKWQDKMDNPDIVLINREELPEKMRELKEEKLKDF